MSFENRERKSKIEITRAAPEDARAIAEVFYKTWSNNTRNRIGFEISKMKEN